MHAHKHTLPSSVDDEDEERGEEEEEGFFTFVSFFPFIHVSTINKMGTHTFYIYIYNMYFFNYISLYTIFTFYC